uniref:Uncharacterized protein n=1 Tax=Timema tahoe TaxID=61484 RepID=A0A7R9NY76_9NEOP|nr:unnamed protein product [Timema tahoe]
MDLPTGNSPWPNKFLGANRPFLNWSAPQHRQQIESVPKENTEPIMSTRCVAPNDREDTTITGRYGAEERSERENGAGDAIVGRSCCGGTLRAEGGRVKGASLTSQCSPLEADKGRTSREGCEGIRARECGSGKGGGEERMSSFHSHLTLGSLHSLYQVHSPVLFRSSRAADSPAL